MSKIAKKVSELSSVDNDKLSLVCYTDGAARPNPGYAGWGVHGYLFYPITAKKDIKIRTNLITDLGYLNVADSLLKHSKAVEPVEYFEAFGSFTTPTTNNAAELSAVLNTLRHFRDKELGYIFIYLDSEYVLYGIKSRCAVYEKNNWKDRYGKPIHNKELWKEIWFLVKEYMERGVVFYLEWVKGHSGDIGNELADSLATLGVGYSNAGELKNEFEIIDASKYGKVKHNRHPFLSSSLIYFNSLEDYNVPGHYFQAGPGGTGFIIGKRLPESSFSVVRLKEPVDIIETVKNRQYELSNDSNAIMCMFVDKLYSRDIYQTLSVHGRYSLLRDTRNLNLNFITGEPLTKEENPTGLSLRALESFNFLEDLLNLYLECRVHGFDIGKNHLNLEAHDITPLFFEITTTAKGKNYKLYPKYTVGFREMSIGIEFGPDKTPINVPYILGLDILPRNNLNNLRDLNPFIQLITWKESEGVLRYATVIETDDAIGVWSNYFSDRIYLAN